MSATNTQEILAALLEQWRAAQNTPGGEASRPQAWAAFTTQLAAMPRGIQAAFHQTIGEKVRELGGALDSAREAIQELQQSVESLLRPPRPAARVRSVSADGGTALVALDPTTCLEVTVSDEAPPEALRPGDDVVLTPDRTAVIGVIGPPDPAWSGVRLLAFRRWLGGASPDGARHAVITDRGEDRVVAVPAAAAAEVDGRVTCANGAVSLLVDRYDQVHGADGSGPAQPGLQAAPFRIPLAAVRPEGIVGLEAERRIVERAAARALVSGAIVIAQGPPGTGKTHLAGYARHLLSEGAEGGEAVVLGLKPGHDHRYFRQEEADIAALAAAAQALAKEGRRVVIFLDEVDRHFYRPRSGYVSVHDNSARATWLEQLGGAMDLRGVLVYCTTNKADSLPDEFLNRANFLLTFGRIEPAAARAILDLNLPADAAAGALREDVLDAVADAVFDDAAGAAIATAVFRDRSTHSVLARDLRQVSARFFKELALRLGEAAGALTVESALAVCRRRFLEVAAGARLTPENLAERTFLEISPRNPPEEVRTTAPPSAGAGVFRYTPLEVQHEPV